MAALNHWLFFWINLSDRAPGSLLGLARLSSTVLSTGLLLMVLLALCVGSWRRLALRMVLAIVMAWLMARGIAWLFPGQRPFVLGMGHQWLAHSASPGFPSSHASVAWAFAWVGWAQAPRGLTRWVPVLLALLISWSRVALGVHFPLDVLAGAVVGASAAGLVRYLCARTWPGGEGFRARLGLAPH